MRFMIIRKAASAEAAGGSSRYELLAAIGQYYVSEVMKFGPPRADDRLQPASPAESVKLSIWGTQGELNQISGPGEIAGISLIEVDTLAQAIDWVTTGSAHGGAGRTEVEIRRLLEPDELDQDAA